MEEYKQLAVKKSQYDKFTHLLLRHANKLGKKLSNIEFFGIMLERFDASDWEGVHGKEKKETG